jgi:hypothetical protein
MLELELKNANQPGRPNTRATRAKGAVAARPSSTVCRGLVCVTARTVCPVAPRLGHRVNEIVAKRQHRVERSQLLEACGRWGGEFVFYVLLQRGFVAT